MSDWFGVTVVSRVEGGLEQMVARAIELGIGTGVETILLRGLAGADGSYTEIQLRVEPWALDESLDAMTTELVMRLLDGIALDSGALGPPQPIDALLGWRHDGSFELGLDDAPLAFAVTGRDPLHTEAPGSDGQMPDQWVDLSVLIATRLVPWLATVGDGRTFGSAAYRAYDEPKDRFMNRFPPPESARFRWRHRHALLDEGVTVALAPHAPLLMAVGDEGSIVVFDLDRGEKVATRAAAFDTPRTAGIPNVAADPNSGRVLMNVPQGRLRAVGWNAEGVDTDWSGREAEQTQAHFAYAPTGELVRLNDLGDATFAYGPEIALVDPETFKRRRILATHALDAESISSAVRCWAFASDAPRGTSGDGSGNLAAWSLDDEGWGWHERVAEEPLHSLAMTSDASSIYALTVRGWLLMVDGSTGEVRKRVHVRGPGRCRMAIDPTDRTLVIANGMGVSFFELDAREFVRHWFIPGSVRFQTRLSFLGFTRDGRFLCVVSGARLDVLEAGRP